jgi:hypothetical protein
MEGPLNDSPNPNIMNNRNRILIVLFFFLLKQAGAQTLEATLKTYASHYEQEKVHIHYDKDGYLPGETVWLKAYLMSGSKPSGLSRNLYFDWTDAGGNLLLHTVSPVTDGVATSSFVIPAVYAGNAIHVKAYTEWMLNFDRILLYNKDIPVLAPFRSDDRSKARSLPSLRFYPEGGDLVNGLTSQVAFEATDQYGRPSSVRGIIRNSKNEIIDSFATVHDGMGSFQLKPAAGEKYVAVWQDEYGRDHSTDLPQQKATGAVLQVRASRDNNINFQVERPADASDNLKTLTVMGTTNQQVVFRSVVDLKNKTVGDGIIYSMQISGPVMQLTVLDESMAPVAERVVFLHNYQGVFETRIKKNLINLNRRGRNEISVEVPDSLGSDLSISVTDGTMPFATENNIVSDFLLSCDIRGHVNNAAWYFSNNSDSSKYYLDLVMRTHAWRRFAWEDVVAGKLPVIQYPADSDYLVLHGKIGPVISHFDAGDSISLLLIGKDRKKYVSTLPLASDGSFTQIGMFFYDSLQVVYYCNHPGKLGPNPAVTFHTGLRPEALEAVAAAEPNFQWSRVPDVVLEKESAGELTETNNYGKQPTGLNYVFTPVKRSDSTKTNYETASKYLQDNFPALKFPTAPKDNLGSSGGDSRYAAFTVNTSSAAQAAGVARNNVNLLLDGSPATLDDLKRVSMKEVLFLELLQKKSPKDLPALAIITRQSVVEDNIMKNKTGFAIISGYAPVREFYNTQYTAPAMDEQLSDFRSTLYWNPKLVFDRNHRKIDLTFYNNDLSGKFRVVIEGMNRQGKLTRLEEIIK